MGADPLAQCLLIERVPHHRADQSPGVTLSRYIDRDASAHHQRTVMRGLVIVAVEQDQVAVRDKRSKRHFVRGRGSVEHEIGLLRPEDLRGFLLRLQRGALVGQKIAEVEHRVVEVVAEHRLAEMFHKYAPDRAAAVEHAAIVARAGPELVTFFCIVHEGTKERRLQCFGILFEATDEVLRDKGRGLLRDENVAVDEVKYLHGEIFEALVSNQEDDRKVEAAPAHEVDEGGGLAFQPLLAPVASPPSSSSLRVARAGASLLNGGNSGVSGANRASRVASTLRFSLG